MQDVIVFDFFEDSPFGRWRILDPVWDTESSHGFDPVRDRGLLPELKTLYVAASRARSNLWFFDSGSEQADTFKGIWKAAGLVSVLGASDEAGGNLATVSSSAEWESAGVRLMAAGNFAEALSAFNRSGSVSLAQQARACIHQRKGEELEGQGGQKNGKLASKEYEQGAALFSEVSESRRAAILFQKLFKLSSKPNHIVSAALAWEKVTPKDEAGKNMLACLEAGLPSSQSQMLRALELPWMTRDEAYYGRLRALAYLAANTASDDDVLKLARLFEADEGLQFLQDFDKDNLVETLLRSTQDWESLATHHEERAELDTAKSCWTTAGRTDVVELLQRREESFAKWWNWVRDVQKNRKMKDDSEASIGPFAAFADHPYINLVKLELRIWILSNTANAREGPRDNSFARTVLQFLQAWQTEKPSFVHFLKQVKAANPPLEMLRAVGLYRLAADENMYAVANEHVAVWRSPSVGTISKFVEGFVILTREEVCGAFGRHIAALLDSAGESISKTMLRLSTDYHRQSLLSPLLNFQIQVSEIQNR